MFESWKKCSPGCRCSNCQNIPSAPVARAAEMDEIEQEEVQVAWLNRITTMP